MLHFQSINTDFILFFSLCSCVDLTMLSNSSLNSQSASRQNPCLSMWGNLRYLRDAIFITCGNTSIATFENVQIALRVNSHDIFKHTRFCNVCDVNIAKWVTENNERVPEDPFFFCDVCYRGYNYDENGEKIGNFRAYPYVDVNALWFYFDTR